jgi:hypothetical protein
MLAADIMRLRDAGCGITSLSQCYSHARGYHVGISVVQLGR